MLKRLLLLSLILAACAQPTVAPIAPPVIVAVATFTPGPTLPAGAAVTPLPTPAEPQPLVIAAPDGTSLSASFYPPVSQPAPGVLLLHMLGGRKDDWDTFARELQKQGFAALALDLRGHGQSGGTADWAKAPGDVKAAWAAMIGRPEVDGKRSAIVGASIGANLALIVGANNGDVAAVAALWPGLDFHGLQPAPVLPNFGQRPVFFLASQDDGYSYDSVKQMAGRAPAGEAYYFSTAGHGTAMLQDPALAPLLIDWLQRYTGAMKG
jgi:alpha-beta hydrolase superfamily lysophospholipase